MYGPDRRGEGEARKKAVELAKDGGSQAVVKLYSGLGGKAAGHLVVPALDSQAAMEELFSQSMSTGRGGDISTDLVEIIPGENVPESTNPVQDFVDGKRDDVPTFDEVDAADNRPIRDEPAEADPEAVFEDYARQIRRKQDYELANNELYDEILQNFTLSDGRAEELVGRLETKVSGSRNEDQISRKRRFFRRVEAINEAETVKQVNQQIALEKEDQPLPSGITDDYTSRMMNRAKIAQRRIKDNEAADPDPTSVPDESDQQPETSGLSGIRQVGKMSGQKGMRRIAPSYLTGEQSVAWLEGYDSASAEGEAKPKNLDDEISNISSEDLSSLFDDVVSDEKPSEPVSEPEPGTEPTTKTPDDATNTPRAEKTDEQKAQDREKRQRATIQKNRNSGQLTRANGQSFRTKSGAADQLKRWNLQNTHYIYGKKGEGFTIKSLPEIGQDNARSVGWLGDNNSFYLYGFNQGNIDAINAWVDGKIVNFKPEFDGGDGGQVSPSAPLTKPEAGQKVIKIENPDQAMRRLQAAGMEMNARLPYLNDDYPDILPQERSAAEIAKSFGSNLTSAGVESLKALENLFGGPGRLGSGLQFDEDTYARAKPHFKKMLEDSRAAGDDLRAFIRKIVSYLGLGSKPYVMRFVEELQSEQVKTTDNAEPDSAPATNPESDYAPKPGTLARKLYDRLDEITDNRKLKAVIAEHFDVSAKEVTDQQMKQAQEALELALVTRARDIVQRDSTRTDRAVFDELQAMYAAQPNLNVRSSGSMQRQAYSTPAPLAFLASRLSGITEATTVYEPTAGNGMLLIGAPADNIVANELDAERAELLEAQGIEVSQADATTFIPADQVDSVIMNPPFGRLKDEAGKPQPVKIDGYTIKAIDHLIAAKALEAMQDDGQATMIIGASKLAGDIAAADRTFFNWLYRNYNVTSHFEVDGDLYNRQGAGWPVRVITIKGRQASNRVSPKSGVIERANNWSEVYAQYERGLAAQQSDGSRTEDTGGTDKPDATDGPVPTEAVSGEQNRPDGDGRGNDGRGGALDPDNGSRPGDRDRTGDGDSTDGRGGVTGGQSEPADIGVGSEQQAGNNTQGPGVTGTTDTGGLGGQSTAGKPGKLSKSEFQTPYNAKSKGKNDAVLTPNNMALPLEQALTDLENEVGDLDTYVQEKLGYDTVAEMHESFMGLQVDAVAAAIYNIENNKGIIIADQTGVGKGRQAAAIIRYARRVGKTPVFMSVTPNLFSDMYGDLQDIGDFDVKPFIVNSAERITYKEREVYKSEGGKRHKSQLQAMAATGKMPGDADTLFLTYSQIQTDNLQRQVMSKMAENAIFVLDEAHNVSGNRSTSIPASKGGGEKLTGAGFMFSLINEKPVAYLSATYAKRPDNMPLYYRTDLSKAVDEIDQLAEAVSQGGLQLQAVISNMLARAGQLFRRERSFEGIKITTSIDTDNTAAHEKLSDQVAEGLSAINRADKMFHNVAMEGIKEAAEEGGGGAKGAGNRAGNVDHMNFSSVIHNYIGQLLLGLKVERSASQAIELHRKGVKPVIALENTMESFLSEYVNDMGIQVGDPVEANYNDVLLRALERSRRYSRELPNGDKEAVQVSLSELDPATREAYQEAQKVIKQLDIADIPMSPIDLMRYRMTQAGMKPSEITGRNMTLDYSTNPPTLAKRDPTERTDKRATVDAFNTGRLDALVLNVSGSTGLSIHASENFKDQKPRHMIVAQAPKDINILMQMLGRINRTGQVVKPEFTMMGLNIPSEKRPLSVTSKKMKSLNANTSANDKSDTSVEAPDILNKYGDQVVAEYLSANPELATELDLGFTASPDGEAESRPTEGLAMKFTGRLARTPVETQKLAYEEIESAFSQLIEYLTKTGQNDLDPQTVDLDARIMASKVVYEGKDPTSLLGGNTTLHKVDAKYQGKPPTGKDVQSALDETLKGGKTPKQIADELILDLADHPGRSAIIERALERVDATEAAIQKAAKEDGLEGGEPAEILEQSKLRDDSELNKKYLDLEGNYQSAVSKAKLTQARLDDTRKRTNEALESTFKIGDHVMLDLSDEVVTGVVTGIKTNLKGKGGDAYALSKTRVSFMVNSGIRNIELPLSKLRPSSGIFIQKLSTKAPLDDIFKGQGDLGGEMREQRFIATGNLIAASADRSIPGRIVSFTSQDGNTYQGMMLPRWFKDSSFEDAGSGQYMALRDKAPLSKFLRNNTDALRRAGGVFDKNQIVRMLPKTDGKWTITVPKANKEELAKRVKFSQPLISAMGMEFFGSGKTMTATFEPNRLSAVTEALSDLVQLNALPSMRKQWVAAGGKKEAEAVESFDDSPEQGSGDAPAFLRNQGATGTGLSEPQVQATVDRFLKTYPGADNVTVEIHQSATALPGFKADRDSAGASIAGEYVSRTDTVHLVSAAFTNESDVLKALQEEILVHKGLGFFSPQDREQLYRDIQTAAGESQEVKALWDKTVKEYQAVAESAGLNDEQANRLYAEEMLGSLAQEQPSWMKKGWRKLWRGIKRLLVKAGWVDQSIGTAELRERITTISDAFKRGRQAPRRDFSADIRGGTTSQSRVESFSREDGQPPLPQVEVEEDTNEAEAQRIFEEYQAARQNQSGQRESGRENNGRAVGGRNAAADYESKTKIRRRSDSGSEPAVIFRGSRTGGLKPDDFNESSFGVSTGRPSSGLGVFFSSRKREAAGYGDVETFVLDMRKPYVIDGGDLPSFNSTAEATRYRNAIKAKGYDGIVVDYRSIGGQLHYIPFQPEQAIPTESKTRFSLNSAPAPSRDVLAADISKGLANVAELAGARVIQSPGDLPATAKAEMKSLGVDESSVRGLYVDGELFVVADNLRSTQEGIEVAVHEAVGHKGVRGVLGAELDSAMLRLYRTLPNTPQGRAALAEVKAEYRFLDTSKREDRIQIAEEMVAHLLEKGHRPKAWQRVVAKIRELLRKMIPSIAWTYSDVLALGEQSRQYLRRRKATGGEGTRFATTDADQQYMNAVDSGNMELAEKMVADAARQAGIPVIEEEGVTAYEVRRDAPPKKTQKAYKLFRVKRSASGEVFPLYVGANDALPQDVWLDALEGLEAEPSKTGKRKVQSKIGHLAYRPGWHAGDIPLATHIGAKDPSGKVFARKEDEVWAEVEMAADVDYQGEADENGRTEKGGFNEAEADIEEMPENGMYRYKTNANMTGRWIISGSMKVNRILSESEVNDILAGEGQQSMPWAQRPKGSKQWAVSPLDLDRWGLTNNPAKNQRKLLDPVTYDNNEDVIPLSKRFNQATTDVRFSLVSNDRISGGNLFDDFTDADRAAAAKQGPRSAPRRVMDYWKEATNNAGLKIRQGMVDRLASLKAIDEKLLGEKMLGEDITRSSWVLGRMANAANGALHTMLHSGRIKMDARQKVIDIQEGDSKGLGAVFAQLASQNDPDSASKEVQRFMGWIAGNRARKLLDEGRENLFTEEDITAMESWDRGVLADGRNRAEAYASVFQEFQAYRDDVLAIADQAGLLRKAMDPDDATLFMANKHGIRSDLADKAKAARKAAARADDIVVKEMAEERESAAIGELQQELVAELGMADYDSEYDMLTTDQRDLWANEFYVPFYRIAEDDNKPTGQLATSGLSRQKAYTRLKGGSQNVNDLLENTMMNFHHLLDASLKNQAAKQAIDNAMDLGIATPVKASNRNEKTSTFVLIDGEKSFYQIDDPLVFESITALSSAGMNNMAMKVMRGFKRLFTNMTTTTPQFMVANLIRDSLQATATNDVSKNAFANVIGGTRSYRDQKIKAQMMASGASFNFGHLFGSNPDELRAQLTRDMRGAKLIDGPQGVPDALRKSWEWWNNVNNATENLNRAAIFTQNQDKGKLKAAFESRDLIDFSAHGAWSAVRILIDVVPFLNARIQGLDKIYRSGFKPGYNVLKSVFGGDDANVSDKQSAGRFWAVTGALAMATMMLYLHNQDDEEYEKLEDWQKDTYWFFRIGDQAFFIPKPFEVGAIATMVERITQQFVDDKATGKLFRERMQHMLTDTFAITIVPQAMQPALDVYANYDAFTQRPIESMGMDRLSPELRKRASTSKAGEWISQGLNATVGALGDPELNPLALSPVQVDHLISGYFGQVGTWAASSGDIAWRVASGHEDPARRWYEYQPVRRFYKNLGDEDRYTKYGTVFYEGLREAGRAYADVKELRELGRLEEAAKAVQDNRQMLMIRRSLNRAQSKLRDINKQIDVIRRADMDGELKRQKLDRLRAIKNKIQKVMSTRVMEARG
jgi:hypothetical protein